MPACSNCGEETDLHYHGFPLCVDCSGSGMFPDHILPEPEKENSSELPPGETPPE